MMYLHPLFCILFIFTTTFATPFRTCNQPASPVLRASNWVISRLWPLRNNRLPITGNCDSTVDTTKGANLVNEDIVLRFNVSTVEEVRAIADAAQEYYLDIWAFNDNWVDIRLSQDFVKSLLNVLPPSLRSSYAPLIPETTLKSLVSTSIPSSATSFTSLLSPAHKEMFFDDYRPLSVIYSWLRLLASMFPDHARIVTVGTSYEGREILGLRLGTRPATDEPPTPRKTILITGGTHAREWISVSSVNYLLYNMVTGYGKSAMHTMFLDKFDWVFVPIINPDGYEYSWTSDRLWRKNRQPTTLRFCRGIDLDRSYGFQFGTAPIGNPCSENFAGSDPWEATETSQIREWVRNQTQSETEIVAYLDLHSYSQQILYPYSYSCDTIPPSLETLEELAFGLAKAMRMSTSRYSYYSTAAACEGNVALNGKNGRTSLSSVEQGGGSALDWFYHEIGVKFSYQIKLRDTGSYGFLLPKEQIVPTGKEVLGALHYLGRFLLGEIGMAAEDIPVEENQQHKEVTPVPQEDGYWQGKITKLDFRRRR